MSLYRNTHLQVKSYRWKITIMVHEPGWLRGHTINKGATCNKHVSGRITSKIKVINPENQG